MGNVEQLEQIPFVMKVTENVYRLSVHFPFAMRQLNSYLFRGEKGFTVIDTGSKANESIEIWEQVLSSGITIEKIFFTHVHADHIALAGWFQENYHIPVFVSDLQYKEVQRIREDNSGKWMSSLIKLHGGPEIPEEFLMLLEPFAYEFEPDGVFESHESIQLGNDTYETIWTPGHSPDHICFYNYEQQLMVVGDHVLGEISPIVAVWSNTEVNPLQVYFNSLDLVSSYATNLVLPAHGDFIQSLPKRSEEIKSGHMYRMKQILDTIKNEAKTADKIYRDIYGKLNIYKFFAPLMTTITRLIYLESVGKVHSELKDGLIYYYTDER